MDDKRICKFCQGDIPEDVLEKTWGEWFCARCVECLKNYAAARVQEIRSAREAGYAEAALKARSSRSVSQ
jgi:hypothetical protein